MISPSCEDITYGFPGAPGGRSVVASLLVLPLSIEETFAVICSIVVSGSRRTEMKDEVVVRSVT